MLLFSHLNFCFFVFFNKNMTLVKKVDFDFSLATSLKVVEMMKFKVSLLMSNKDRSPRNNRKQLMGAREWWWQPPPPLVLYNNKNC